MSLRRFGIRYCRSPAGVELLGETRGCRSVFLRPVRLVSRGILARRTGKLALTLTDEHRRMHPCHPFGTSITSESRSRISTW